MKFLDYTIFSEYIDLLKIPNHPENINSSDHFNSADYPNPKESLNRYQQFLQTDHKQYGVTLIRK